MGFAVALSCFFDLTLFGGLLDTSNREVTVPNYCGPIALQVCAIVSGRDVTTAIIDDVVAVKGDGCSLLDLENAARALGIETVAVRWSNQCPADGSAPAVIPIVNRKGKRHFVAVAGWQAGKALIVDVPNGPIWVDVAQLREKLAWEGAALHIGVSATAQLGGSGKSSVGIAVYAVLMVILSFVIARAVRGVRQQ